MNMRKRTPKTVGQYIAGYPRPVQVILRKFRAKVRKSAPGAKEAIKYGIPTLVLNGNLVSYGAFTNHLGFFPTGRGVEAFKKELKAYEGSKGTVRFPYDKPIPYGLVGRMVKFRVKADRERAKNRGRK